MDREPAGAGTPDYQYPIFASARPTRTRYNAGAEPHRGRAGLSWPNRWTPRHYWAGAIPQTDATRRLTSPNNNAETRGDNRP